MTDSIHSQRGGIQITAEAFRKAKKETLALLFSRFYPFAIENTETPSTGIIKMWGVSPDFDSLDTSHVGCPLYDMKFLGENTIEFIRIE